MARQPLPSARADVYSRITDEIVAAVQSGAGEWRMPWHHDGAATSRPTNVALDRKYRGVNVLALWAAALRSGYGSGLWGTYNQWAAAGAQVRRGERATTVVLWKELDGRYGDDSDEDHPARRRMFARAFSVFNVAQVDGYTAAPAGWIPSPALKAEAFFAALAIPLTTGAYNAHYRIKEDRIYMPPAEMFGDVADFVGTLIHEAAHATGSPHRLDRNFRERFGPETLAMEEITAELTAGFVLADLGIAHRPRPDHAAYIASWLRLLKNDPRAIFTAAGQAQKAADWMHAQQPLVTEQGGAVASAT